MSTAPPNPFLGKLIGPDIGEMLDAGETREVRAALLELDDPDIADVIDSLTPEKMALVFRLLPRKRASEVFAYLPSDRQEELITELNSKQLAQILEGMEPDDRVDLLEELPGLLAARLLSLMRPDERAKTQTILNYPPESVGSLITPEYVALRPEWTEQQSLEYVRKHGRDAETVDTLYVVDGGGQLLGSVRLRQLLLADPASRIDALMDVSTAKLRVLDDQEEAVRVMQRYDRPVLPVVDRDDVLVGIVTFDDVADVAESEATEDIHKLGGMEALEEPYLTATIWELTRKRGIWLSVLFVGEMLTTSAMTYFEEEIARAMVLALFVPLIISSGGNSGSQATSLMIRGLAIGEIVPSDWGKVLRRELACGLMLGLMLGLMGLLRIQMWSSFGWADYTAHAFLVGVTVACSLTGIVLFGSVTGSMLPFIMRKFGIDPATSSAPFVATLVDVSGVVIYFTIAALILRGTLL